MILLVLALMFLFGGFFWFAFDVFGAIVSLVIGITLIYFYYKQNSKETEENKKKEKDKK